MALHILYVKKQVIIRLILKYQLKAYRDWDLWRKYEYYIVEANESIVN